MKRIIYIIFLVVYAASCINEEGLGYEPEKEMDETSLISPSVRHAWTAEMPMTRALVDNLTTRSLEANFLRIDEDIQGNAGLYTYLGLNNGASEGDKTIYSEKINWEKAKIVEASVISSPDKDGRRSVFLNPVQGYPMYVKSEGDRKMTTYYHTRLVSWYPRTCELIKDANTGMAADYVFDNYNNSMVSLDPDFSKYEAEDGSVKIRFTGLNGQKDVMVSDVVEAQHWHEDDDPDVVCANSPRVNPHRMPLGHNEANPEYENIMTYKHYLSAIRVNAYPSDVSQQTIGLWGKIKRVVVVGQPTECHVTLPCTVDPATGKSDFGVAEFLDGESQLGDFDLVRTSMFGDDPNNDVHYLADPVSTLDGYTQAKPMKLGYALIAPDRGVTLDVHTDAGVYRVAIPHEYTVIIKDGSGNETKKTIDLFDEGKIYDITLKFETSNTIAAILLTDDGKNYYDLTAGKSYDSAYGEEYFDYKHSNCYIIHPGIQQAGSKPYDGFSFDATVVGNGDEGILPGFNLSTADIDPASVGLIWESSYGLIQQVELLYGYVRFRVPNYQEKTGNAVIGVFGEDGNILWSWHIWIAPSLPGSIAYQLGDVEVNVMDRNLGSLFAGMPENGEEALKSYGLYYQWGRKDPSMGPPSYDYFPMSTATSYYYDGFGGTQQSTGVLNIARPQIQDGIQNPMYLILPTEWSSYYQFDWLYHRVDNLWGDVGSLRKKTIYDPCPEGYWIPGDQLNMILQDAKNNGKLDAKEYALAVENGEHDIIFPYTGYKGVDRGMSSLVASWKYVGQKGDYMNAQVLADKSRGRGYVSKSPDGWSETGTDGKQSVYYQGGHFNIDAGGANRRTAATVRCVKAEPFGSIQIILSSDRNSYVYGETVSGTYDYVVQGDAMYNMTQTIQYGFSDNPDSYSGVQDWFDGELDTENGAFRWTLDGAGLPNEIKYMWIKMTIALTDLDVTIDKYICCTYYPDTYVEKLDIALEQGRYVFGNVIRGKYSAMVVGDSDAEVEVQYVVSSGFSTPDENSWKTGAVLDQAEDAEFSFSVNVNEPEYLTYLWVRIKVVYDDKTVYSDEYSCLFQPQSIVSCPPSDISEDALYVLIPLYNDNRYLAVNDGTNAALYSIDSMLDDNRNYVFVIESIEQVGSNVITDGKGNNYYNVIKGVVKHYATGKYLWWDGTDDNTPLTLSDSNKTAFYFCSDWNGGGDTSTMDIRVDENNNYNLYTNTGYSNLWINSNWNSNQWQWRLVQIE